MNLLNMKIIKLNYLTVYFLLILLLCGYIKIGIIVLAIVLFHEFGHVLVAKVLGYKIIDVTIYPFGGITRLEKDINAPINHELIIAGAGIIFQIILFMIVLLLPLSNDTLNIFFKYNMSILFFNILPIIPLDGSIILNCILNKIFSYKKSYVIYVICSVVNLIIYIIFSCWYALNNYLIITLFIYKIFEAIKNFKYLRNRFWLERYLNNYNFKYISTKEGGLDILKVDTYQYFKDKNKVISEKTLLKRIFDK